MALKWCRSSSKKMASGLAACALALATETSGMRLLMKTSCFLTLLSLFHPWELYREGMMIITFDLTRADFRKRYLAGYLRILAPGSSCLLFLSVHLPTFLLPHTFFSLYSRPMFIPEMVESCTSLRWHLSASETKHALPGVLEWHERHDKMHRRALCIVS